MQVRASALRRVLTASCAAAIAASAIGCGGDGHRASCDKAFDQAAWRSTGAEGRNSALGAPSKRQSLADGIIACQTLDGRTRSDVRRLLGKPDFPSRATRFYYELGEGRSAGSLDNEFLSVTFDRRSRVDAVEIVGF